MSAIKSVTDTQWTLTPSELEFYGTSFVKFLNDEGYKDSTAPNGFHLREWKHAMFIEFDRRTSFMDIARRNAMRSGLDKQYLVFAVDHIAHPLPPLFLMKKSLERASGLNRRRELTKRAIGCAGFPFQLPDWIQPRRHEREAILSAVDLKELKPTPLASRLMKLIFVSFYSAFDRSARLALSGRPSVVNVVPEAGSSVGIWHTSTFMALNENRAHTAPLVLDVD